MKESEDAAMATGGSETTPKQPNQETKSRKKDTSKKETTEPAEKPKGSQPAKPEVAADSVEAGLRIGFPVLLLSPCHLFAQLPEIQQISARSSELLEN